MCVLSSMHTLSGGWWGRDSGSHNILVTNNVASYGNPNHLKPDKDRLIKNKCNHTSFQEAKTLLISVMIGLQCTTETTGFSSGDCIFG